MRAGNSSIYAAAARFFRVPALAQATDAAILQRLMEEHHVLSRPVTLPARFLSETRQPMWVNLKDGGEGGNQGIEKGNDAPDGHTLEKGGLNNGPDQPGQSVQSPFKNRGAAGQQGESLPSVMVNER